MQYIHKLARRLALSRGVALATLVAVAGACDQESGDELGPLDASPLPTPATKLVITDHPPRVGVHEQVQLTAEGRSLVGREALVEVEWTATGGTIDSSGLFSAAATGSYTVYARGRGRKDLGDSTTIRVSRPALVSVEITPGDALLAPGKKQVFSATGTLKDGSQVQLDADWSSTGGTIDSMGVYQAPRTHGNYRVIATSKKGLADTATVAVSSADSGATIQRIVLTPASVALEPGGAQAFTASARMSDNTLAPVEVSYIATGGSITPEGLYQAGSAAGTYRVIAAAADGKADTSAVTVAGGAPQVQEVVLTPASVSLAPGGTQQFSASAKLGDGTSAPAAVTYSVTGGTVTGGGLYTAGQSAGTYRVIATAENGKADTAGVTVEAAPSTPDPTLERIVLTPSSVTLVAGARQQFSASGRMSDGSTSTVAVSYSATGGSVTAEGLYTAGQSAGSFRVVATQQGGALADTAAVTITSVSSGGTGPQAAMADSLVESISVQTHLSYNNVYTSGWSSIIRPRLLELGVRHIRERMVDNTTVQARVRDLGANGIKLTAGCWPQNGNYADASHCIARANAYGTGTIDAFDGWNEVDNKGAGWASAWMAWQKTLWSTYKAHPTWKTRPLYANSLARAASTDDLGNQSSLLDYGNMHSYPAGDVPSVVSKAWIPQWNRVASPKGLVVTETGYHNCLACPSNGVSFTAQSKYLGRLIFEYFNRGIKRTNIYELIDEGVSTTSREDNWGLLRNNGEPKPSFITIRNLITLLSDKGSSFNPGRLDYALSGALATTHSTLLQKRDGRFYLVLWQEVRSWDVANRRDLTSPDDEVTLTLGAAARTINVYRPGEGTRPVQSGSGSSMKLSVPDELIIVEIAP